MRPARYFSIIQLSNSRGYVYEGEELPPDFICPLCKHGASDFEKIDS